MGPIHPRIKIEVGRRLATAAYNLLFGGEQAFTGPTISGCHLSGNTIEVTFNSSLLRNEKVVVRDFPTNFSDWSEYSYADSSMFHVCVGSEYHGVGIVGTNVTCGCYGWDYYETAKEKTAWYCAAGPKWGPYGVSDTTRHKKYNRNTADASLSGTEWDSPPPPPLTWRPDHFDYLTTRYPIWHPVPLKATGPNTVAIDLSHLNSTFIKNGVYSIRYGWPFNDHSKCCPTNAAQNGFEICTPGGCPIFTSNTNLPANSFFANIVDGKCNCLPPQVC